MGPLHLCQVGQAAQQLPLLGAALPGLVRRQGGKRGVQVKVRPVDEFQHGVVPFFYSRASLPLGGKAQLVEKASQSSRPQARKN